MKAQTNPRPSEAETRGPAPQSHLHFGDTIDLQNDTENCFSVSMLPIDIFDSWDRCGDIADFVATYFQYSFRSPNSKGIISTVVNELIENAVKYSRNKSSTIQLEVRKRQENLLLQISNLIPRNQRDHFVVICQDLFQRDLEELYVEKLTHAQQDRTFSGIGLILLKKDYEARLGMDIVTDSKDLVRVDVTVELAVS
ncbi:MAG: GHKL domain-containing protein [bacterium]|nr:GHKL domain-containing protein [bacterium]